MACCSQTQPLGNAKQFKHKDEAYVQIWATLDVKTTILKRYFWDDCRHFKGPACKFYYHLVVREHIAISALGLKKFHFHIPFFPMMTTWCHKRHWAGSCCGLQAVFFKYKCQPNEHNLLWKLILKINMFLGGFHTVCWTRENLELCR